MGDSPDGMEMRLPFENQAKMSWIVQPFRSASRRPERAGRPFHPFLTQALQNRFVKVSVTAWPWARLSAMNSYR
jgi:hypothetical protein